MSYARATVSAFHDYVDDASAYRSRQRCVIPFGLIGICESKSPHRLVEIILLAEVAADRPWVAGLRMGTCQYPTAGLGVDRQHLGVIGLDQHAELHVTQLTHVEVPPLWPRGPTEEQVGGRLHQPLALNHPFAVMGIGALAGIGLQDGSVCFLHLQEERVARDG